MCSILFRLNSLFTYARYLAYLIITHKKNVFNNLAVKEYA